MIETRGVVHFSIPVSDLDRSEAFYREILGLETVSHAPEPLNLLFMKSGDDFVVLVKAKTPINPNMGDERFVHHAFRIDIGKYEESRAFLVEIGGQPAGHSFYARMGRRRIDVTIRGVVFRDGWELFEVLKPALRGMAAYRP